MKFYLGKDIFVYCVGNLLEYMDFLLNDMKLFLLGGYIFVYGMVCCIEWDSVKFFLEKDILLYCSGCFFK